MEFPIFSNYYSDYISLTFYFDKRGKAQAMYLTEEDEFGEVTLQAMAMNLTKFMVYYGKLDGTIDEQKFIEWFLEAWLHEWFHLIGITDLGINLIAQRGFPVTPNKVLPELPCIELEGEDPMETALRIIEEDDNILKALGD